METVELNLGEALYRQGDDSDFVYFVEAGEVEVRRQIDGDEVTVARLGKGQILGEMGVIQGAPRSASVVAAGDVRLMRMNAAAFTQAFGGADGTGLKILKMVCQRLAATNAAVGRAADRDAALRRDIGEIRLLGDSPFMSKLLGNTGIVVRSLPFEIGATPLSQIIVERDRLALPTKQMAAGQLRIELSPNGEVLLHNQAPGYYAEANGVALDAGSPEGASTPLRFGDNAIVAGGAKSQICLTLRIRRAKAAAA